MPETTAPPSLDHWRYLLAFGISTLESLNVEIWSIKCDRGDSLGVHLAGEDYDEARRVAEALGVDLSDAVVSETDTTYTVGSRGPKPSYYKEPEPYPYFGASVPFGDRLVEITVTCGNPARHQSEVQS